MGYGNVHLIQILEAALPETLHEKAANTASGTQRGLNEHITAITA